MSYYAKDSEFSVVHFDNLLVDLILQDVKKDVLPDEDVQVPEWELPPLDAEGENPSESIKEKEQKWTDLAITKVR